MTSKVRFKNLKSLFNVVKSDLDDSLKDNDFLNEASEYVVTRIQQQSRVGNSLVTGNFPELSDNYKRYRSRLKSGKVKNSVVTPSKFLKPATSQVTLTGQMLDSLKYKILPNLKQIEIFPTGVRQGESLTNEKLTEELEARGYKYLGLDKFGFEQLRRRLVELLRRNITFFKK